MESGVAEATGGEPVRQFAVFAENKVGRLNDLVGLLASHSITPMAITTQDTTDSTIIRMVVDDPGGARELMSSHGYAFTESELIAAEMMGPRDLRKVLSALMGAEINIHYIYPFITRPQGRCALALHLEDNDLAAQVLNAAQIRILKQEDISR